jgi:hypothetical protein
MHVDRDIILIIITIIDTELKVHNDREICTDVHVDRDVTLIIIIIIDVEL